MTARPLCGRFQSALSAGALALLATATPAQTPARTLPVFTDGLAQIVPGFQDTTQWIRQTLWVETEFDSDGDGKRDRVYVDVTRQRQTETEGLKVPVIYLSSPYYPGTSGPRQFLWDVRQELGVTPPPRTSQPQPPFKPAPPRISNSEVSTWVPRGFAVVHSSPPGTGNSQGCITVGGPPERLAPKAVIDWLNGRAKGFTTIDGTEQVRAGWSTGKVGMTGTSYDGTIPVAAAVTGVKGLEAIIPIAPNTSYYHYYRTNGLVRHPGGWLGEDIDFLYDYINSGLPANREACAKKIRDGEFAAGRDRANGDFNAFWASRDLFPLLKNVKAAVFMAHAFNDWNVVPEHSVRVYEELKKNKIPLMAYFHQGGHGGPPPLDMRVKWFTRYLYDVQNGVERDPRAWIVREGMANTNPTPYPDYPNPTAKGVPLFPQPGGNGIGELGFARPATSAKEGLTDNVQFSGGALAQAERSDNRLIYATPTLQDTLHLSGYTTVKMRVASSTPAANLSVWLVTLPYTPGTGPGSANANVITRGWADPQNHKGLRQSGRYSSQEKGEPLTPGEFVDLTFDLQPTDKIVPAGKRLGLLIMSSDSSFTLWPAAGTKLTVDLGATGVSLPVVGGAEALRKAMGPGRAVP